jgi:hypothetical protein
MTTTMVRRAVVLVRMPPARRGQPEAGGPGHLGGGLAGDGQRDAASRLRGLGHGVAAGTGFGLFFLFLKNAGQSGVLWPVAVSRMC